MPIIYIYILHTPYITTILPRTKLISLSASCIIKIFRLLAYGIWNLYICSSINRPALWLKREVMLYYKYISKSEYFVWSSKISYLIVRTPICHLNEPCMFVYFYAFLNEQCTLIRNIEEDYLQTHQCLHILCLYIVLIYI